MRGTGRVVLASVLIALLSGLDGIVLAEEIDCRVRSVAVGDRIRVFSPELGTWPVSGRLAAVDEEALSMARPDRAGRVRVPWCSIDRLEVARGTHRQTRKGAKVGFFVAGIPLALLGILFSAAGDIDCEHACRGKLGLAAGAGAGLALGAGIGAAIGALARTDRWEPAPSDQSG